MIARSPTKTQPISFHPSPEPIDIKPRSAVPLSIPGRTLSDRPMVSTPPPVAVMVRRPPLATTHAEPGRIKAIQASAAPVTRRQGELSAKYLGGGNLSVRSSVTGRIYRFEGHGAVLPIDSRDQLMLRRFHELLIA